MVTGHQSCLPIVPAIWVDPWRHLGFASEAASPFHDQNEASHLSGWKAGQSNLPLNISVGSSDQKTCAWLILFVCVARNSHKWGAKEHDIIKQYHQNMIAYKMLLLSLHCFRCRCYLCCSTPALGSRQKPRTAVCGWHPSENDAPPEALQRQQSHLASQKSSGYCH